MMLSYCINGFGRSETDLQGQGRSSSKLLNSSMMQYSNTSFDSQSNESDITATIASSNKSDFDFAFEDQGQDYSFLIGLMTPLLCMLPPMILIEMVLRVVDLT